MRLFRPKCITLHLSTLNSICQSLERPQSYILIVELFIEYFWYDLRHLTSVAPHEAAADCLDMRCFYGFFASFDDCFFLVSCAVTCRRLLLLLDTFL